jgi:TrmH family RNA methyltransferase
MLGVYAMPDLEPSTDRVTLTVIADGIQDPGNLGTLIRSAVAFGATSIVCLRGTVDPFSPKVVRAAAAAHFLVPISLSTHEDLAVGAGQLVLAEGEGAAAPDVIDWRRPTTVVIGGEARGVSPDMRARDHLSVAIPMWPGLESLNAGVAASVLLYEADRQRRAG